MCQHDHVVGYALGSAILRHRRGRCHEATVRSIGQASQRSARTTIQCDVSQCQDGEGMQHLFYPCPPDVHHSVFSGVLTEIAVGLNRLLHPHGCGLPSRDGDDDVDDDYF